MSGHEPFFDVSKTKNSIRFVFSSTLENIDTVCKLATDFIKVRLAGAEIMLFSINLVIREGLTNAVRHGNNSDPEKKVSFLLNVTDNERLLLTIEDEGEGFDWRKQLAKQPCQNDDHGRGLLIMEAYFNRYSYNDKGNVLFLEKDISTPI